jgi:NADPH:quinone reductase-like Zn-dependent oxidoreductase
MDGRKLKPGQSVFIYSASCGVGQAAIAIAKVFGAVITARVGPSSLASFADWSWRGCWITL